MQSRAYALLFAAALLGGCQSGGERAPTGDPLPGVNTGDAGAAPTKGRAPTDQEKNGYGLGERPWRVTDDGKGSFYNCLGFAMCSAAFGYRELPRDPSDGMVNAPTMAKADKYFQDLGWTISADCRPKKGVRKVVVYCTPGANSRVDPDDWAVHFAKQYRDDWWEGKMGCSMTGEQPPRILYPGVGSIAYQNGVPCRCYEMGLARLVQYMRTRVVPLIDQQRDNIKPAVDPTIERDAREAAERIKELEDAIKTEGAGP